MDKSGNYPYTAHMNKLNLLKMIKISGTSFFLLLFLTFGDRMAFGAEDTFELLNDSPFSQANFPVNAYEKK